MVPSSLTTTDPFEGPEMTCKVLSSILSLGSVSSSNTIVIVESSSSTESVSLTAFGASSVTVISTVAVSHPTSGFPLSHTW